LRPIPGGAIVFILLTLVDLETKLENDFPAANNFDIDDIVQKIQVY